MITYQTIGTNDLSRACAFYDAVLGEIGYKRAFSSDRMQFYSGPGGGALFAVCKPYDGEPATAGNGTMTAIGAPDLASVQRAHGRAIELGAKDEGAPGPRGNFGEFGYFRDLDGNKIAIANLKLG